VHFTALQTKAASASAPGWPCLLAPKAPPFETWWTTTRSVPRETEAIWLRSSRRPDHPSTPERAIVSGTRQSTPDRGRRARRVGAEDSSTSWADVARAESTLPRVDRARQQLPGLPDGVFCSSRPLGIGQGRNWRYSTSTRVAALRAVSRSDATATRSRRRGRTCGTLGMRIGHPCG